MSLTMYLFGNKLLRKIEFLSQHLYIIFVTNKYNYGKQK